ncbi:sensor histidine kinase [Sphingomonas prati]|uniref:histidine kinase n=1 Tax=Sphingomonas prati TaxID=1843237 RepID=A0A7W9BPJ0_9SPHN|nr:HAMP domain-containing sensor histidine kinase [Sphingomonas prati]MBB5727586.1 signal transduction histidine kinase [Sphingomonas prati]
MRYDDMIGTVLDQGPATDAARSAAWRQVVDLIAQGRGGDNTDRGYAYLRAVRSAVPAELRARCARSLAGRRLPAALVLLFAEDVPAIAAPILSTARLADATWDAVLPRLSPTMRGMLRHRRDLDAETRRALATFGATDLVLGAPDGEADTEVPVAPATVAAIERAPDMVAANPIGVSISDLVKRIDAYRRERPFPVTTPAVPPATGFRFEAGADGVIVWIEGAPREAIVGETLARAAALNAGHGVDGHVAGAFRRRSPFRDARLSVAGSGPAAGDWRISAVPLFAPVDGRFLGYRGTARRPRADEIAVAAPRDAAMLGVSMAPDSLRQLVHELRTPLNAIVGFADMIAAEMLGPVGEDYRARAGAISDDGRRLVSAIDDLDMAARIEAERLTLGGGRIDPATQLADIVARHAGADGVSAIDLTITPGLGGRCGDGVVFDRMVSRLVAAAVGLAERDERVAVTLEPEGVRGVLFIVSRPRRLAGRDERALLDPGYAPDGDWPDGPLLGLGFSLRLIRNLANAAGGSLVIEETRFVLRLPFAVMETEAENA